MLHNGRRWLDKRSPRARRGGSRTRLRLEFLEDRMLPSVYTVNSLGDAGTGSGTSGDLRYCLTQAQADPTDTTITFGVTGTITLESPLPSLLKTTYGAASVLNLQGPGAGSLTLQRDAAAPHFSVLAVGQDSSTLYDVAVRIAGLTVRGGAAGPTGYGGGLENYYSTARTVVADCVFTDNAAGYGGGLDNDGTLLATGCTFSGNTAAYGGGLSNRGTLTLADDTISGNTATFDGGGIANTATLSDTGSTITGNTAGRNGGGLISGAAGAAPANLVNTTVATNSAAFDGGGIYTQYGPVTLTGGTVRGNVAGRDGGGLADLGSGGTLTIDRSTLDQNAATRDGGGLATTGLTTLTYSTVSNGTANAGGGIYAAMITSSVNPTIAWSTVSGNRAVADGGGLVAGATNLTASTFSGNTAGTVGGGLEVTFSGGTATLASCTFAGNSASSGGGLYIDAPSPTNPVRVQACTIAGNHAGGPGRGGGISGYVYLDDTIVAGNSGAAGNNDLYGQLVGGSFNLIGDGTGAQILPDSGNQVGTAANPIDPRLGPLQDNGGPTWTMALGAGSPALGAGGLLNPPATDQRGQPRISGGRIDIGAYELQQDWQPVNHYTVTTLADGGPGSLRDAVTRANADALDRSLIDFAVTGTIALSSALPSLHANIDLEGPGPDHLTVARSTAGGTPVFSIFTVADFTDASLFGVGGPVVQIAGLTITGGAATNGGGVLLQRGTLTLSNDLLTGDTASSTGGAVHTLVGTFLTVADCTLSNNTAKDGGAVSNNGTLRIRGGTFAHNTASDDSISSGGQGGALYNQGAATVSASTFANNLATGTFGAAGGAVDVVQNSTLAVDGCTFAGNTAASTYGGSGGAISNAPNSQAGVLTYYGGQLTITNSTFTGNTASGTSGGVGGGSGGALFNSYAYPPSSPVVIRDCTFTGNTATGTAASAGSGGGAVFNRGFITLLDSSFFNNQVSTGSYAGASGGAVADDGSISSTTQLTISGCTFFGNSAGSAGPAGYYGYGGAVSVNALTRTPATITNSTFTGNTASDGGGAIFLGTNGSLAVNNSTIYGNQVAAGGHGGGLYLTGTGGRTVLYDTIVAGDLRGTTGEDVNGLLDAINSLNNLIGNGTGGNLTDGANGNQIGTHANPIDPLLGPLQDNGGLTRTMAPRPGSPALAAGDLDGVPATDQRGFPRVFGGALDLGAFEVQPVSQATHLVIQSPASITAGTPFDLTVTALDDFGQPAGGYTGAVHFAASNGATADYTFTAADAGQHTFIGLVLRRAATYTVTGADTVTPQIAGSATLTITPAAADHIAFALAGGVTAGAPFGVTVTVQDAYGNTVTDYIGTVHFVLTGPVPAMADYTFTAADQGSHTFSNLVLTQAGDYTLAGTDAADPALGGTLLFTVSA